MFLTCWAICLVLASTADGTIAGQKMNGKIMRHEDTLIDVSVDPQGDLEMQSAHNRDKIVRLDATKKEQAHTDCGICNLDLSKPKNSNDGRSTFMTFSAGLNMKFGSVCTVAGETLDLLITTQSTWTTRLAEDKTVGTMSQINVKSGTGVRWDFQLVRAGTAQPKKVANVILSVLDVDGGPNVQQVKADGFSIIAAGNGICEAQPGVFASLKDGNSTDNPTSITNLTAAQEDSVLSLNFKNVSGWQVSMSIPKEVDGGRNFFVGGSTKLMPVTAVCANTLKSTQLPGCPLPKL